VRAEDVYEEPADGRVRLDPYDPSTFRHAASASTVTRAILLSSAILKIVLNAYFRDSLPSPSRRTPKSRR
jgi:hypothetical protein